MNQKLVTRILALLLVLAMVLGMIPLVFADEGNLGSGTPDGEPPVLERIELSAYDVTAPGTIEVTAYATDDVSGLSYAEIRFYCEETGKYLHCGLDAGSYDWVEGQGEVFTPYPDGALHGTLRVDQYVESGFFYIQNIHIQDRAENYRYYDRYSDSDDPQWQQMPQAVKDLRLNITHTEIADSTPPVLERIEFSTSTVNAPGTVEVTASAADDVSGLRYAEIRFYCEETGKYLHCGLDAGSYDWVAGQGEVFTPYPDGTLRGTLRIDQYVESGSFYIQNVHIQDGAENYRYYDRNSGSDDPQWQQMPQQLLDARLNVIESDTPDSTPPILERIEMASTTIAAPGTVEITAYATDGVSGTAYAEIRFYCEETGKYLHCGLDAGTYDWVEGQGEVFTPYPDGALHGTLRVDQYVESGSFHIQTIHIQDRAGNYRYYDRYSGSDDPQWHQMPQQVLDFRFNVLNAVPDVTTSVSKGEFVDQIKDSADDAYIVADFSGEATLPETAFDAISGTDKTLDLVSEGVTWRFNGNDITGDSKPIDLNVNITKLEESTSAEIQEKLDDTPAVVMKFAENGVLPGKATIQVKVDYAMREYLGASRELCVYYFNNQTGKLELIAENLMVINDTYIEFPITHCSYYILSTKIEEPAEPEHEFQYGDVNHDGRVNVTDAVMVMKHRAGALTEEDTFCERCANVDTNPKINVSDAVLIMKKRANKDMIFPIEAQ